MNSKLNMPNFTENTKKAFDTIKKECFDMSNKYIEEYIEIDME